MSAIEIVHAAESAPNFAAQEAEVLQSQYAFVHDTAPGDLPNADSWETDGGPAVRNSKK